MHLPVYECMSVCACISAHSDSVGGDPWSGSPVTGAHLRFCELSSQCAKQPPEDRISYCDPAPEVTEIHLRGQTWNAHCHVLQRRSQVGRDWHRRKQPFKKKKAVKGRQDRTGGGRDCRCKQDAYKRMIASRIQCNVKQVRVKVSVVFAVV